MRLIKIHELILYAIGLCFLLAGAAGIILALYSTPYLLWGVHYDVPEFVIQFGIWFQQSQHVAKPLQLFALLFPSFLFGSVLIFIAYLIIAWVDSRVRAHVYERASSPPVESNRLTRTITITIIILLTAVGFWLIDYYWFSKGI